MLSSLCVGGAGRVLVCASTRATATVPC